MYTIRQELDALFNKISDLERELTIRVNQLEEQYIKLLDYLDTDTMEIEEITEDDPGESDA